MFGAGESAFGTRPSEPRAATAAVRLAGGDTSAIWRALPDGTIEVAIPRRGRVERHACYPDGTTMLLDTSPRELRRYVSAYLAIGSFFVAFASFVAYGATEGSAIAGMFGWICGLAIASFVVGAVLAQGKNRVRPWLKERLGGDEGWTIVPRQVGSEPSTGNQLIAIASLADDHGGKALFRELEDGRVEVATSKGGAVKRHVVDPAGTPTLVGSTPTRRPLIARAAMVAAVAAAVIGVVFQGWLAAVLFFVVVALVLVAAAAHENVHVTGDREDWQEVRTDKPGD